jgi:hypothetical protein
MVRYCSSISGYTLPGCAGAVWKIPETYIRRQVQYVWIKQLWVEDHFFFYQPVSKAKRNPSPLAELKRSGGDQSRSRSEKGVFDRRLLTV